MSYILDADWWSEENGDILAQGDYLDDCPIIKVPKTFEPGIGEKSSVAIEELNVIVLTQSCDLAQDKTEFVSLCAVWTLDELRTALPKMEKNLESIRQGRFEGFHMIAGFNGPGENSTSLVVDFRQIYSLPIDFLKKFAKDKGSRKRLKSPFLERFAQTFARFFMRVGLPSHTEIRSFNSKNS